MSSMAQSQIEAAKALSVASQRDCPLPRSGLSAWLPLNAHAVSPRCGASARVRAVLGHKTVEHRAPFAAFEGFAALAWLSLSEPEERAASRRSPGERTMLYWTVVLLVIALIAAFLGFGGIAAGAAGIAKILFFVFLVLAVLSFLFGRRAPV
jgi:uncharacterized membrane protein YtjA (UPF0391 family)